MFRDIFVRDKMLMSRLGIALGSFLFGLQLLLPTTLFPTAAQIAAGTGRVTYAYMAAIAPEYVWGIAFLVHSVWAAYTLVTGVRNHVTLAVDAILGCVLWTTATVACYAAHWPRGLPFFEALAAYPPPAAMSSDVVLSVLAWWHMIRMWAEEEGVCLKPEKREKHGTSRRCNNSNNGDHGGNHHGAG